MIEVLGAAAGTVIGVFYLKTLLRYKKNPTKYIKALFQQHGIILLFILLCEVHNFIVFSRILISFVQAAVMWRIVRFTPFAMELIMWGAATLFLLIFHVVVKKKYNIDQKLAEQL